jgi:hypothetical protein
MAATKWATDTNVAIAAGLASTAPPAPLAKPTVSAMEKKWQLRELQRAAAHPHLWALGTATAGAAGWGMDALFTATVSGSAGTLAGLGVTGTAAAVTGITRYAKRGKLGAHDRRFTVAGAVSTGWITLASLGGISWWQLALLATGDLVLGAGYWRALREERRALLGPVLQPEPAVEPVAQIEAPVYVPAEPDPIGRITLWDAHVRGSGGPLEGSTLTAVRTTDIGIEAIIDLKPGKHTLASALGAVPQVRSGLHLAADDGEDNPGEEVLFDQPGHIGDLRLTANQLRVQIVEKSPVRQSPWFERPMFAGDQPGVALIGLYADGHGHAPWVLYDHDGVWSGVIIAGTGGGKSSVMDVLAISARATGVLNTMFIDPQGGASSPIMRKNASILGLGQTQIVPSLLALEAMADHREAYLNAHGLSAGSSSRRWTAAIRSCRTPAGPSTATKCRPSTTWTPATPRPS